MARSADGSVRGADVLALLRAASGPLTLADLREAGISRPAQAIYELQLDGHRITRSAAGVDLFEGARRTPERPEPAPRVRVRPRETDDAA